MLKKPLDYHRLQVFMAVFETHSFTKAANQVLLSQPTVSEHIRSLEESLEERLFDRIGKKIIPTQAAEILYKYAAQLNIIQNEAIQEIGRLSGKIAGNILVGASSVPSAYILPRYIGSFTKEYPGAYIHLQTGSSKKITEAVLTGSLELGLIDKHWDDPDFVIESVIDHEIVLALPYNHPIAKYHEISLDRLRGIPLISREPGSGTKETTEQALAKKGVKYKNLNHVMEAGSSEAVRECIINGIGASFMSIKSIEQAVENRQIQYVRISGIDIKRTFYLLTRKGRTLTPLARIFVDSIIKLNS